MVSEHSEFNGERGGIAPPALERIIVQLEEEMRWSTLSVSIAEISRENAELVRDLSRFDPSTAIPYLAGILTLPQYQSNCIRLEMLIALAMVHCRGRKSAGHQDASRWFSMAGRSRCARGEDSAEDVFVALVNDHDRDYRLIEGVWEAAGFYTQRIVDVISSMPDHGRFEQIKRSALSLLKISDVVCEKAGLHRYQLGSDARRSSMTIDSVPSRKSLTSRVQISFSELDSLGISPDDLAPFIFNPRSRRNLLHQEVGQSLLDRQPLAIYDDVGIVVILPTALSVAMRDFAIFSILDGGPIDRFDFNLSVVYSKLLADTPLLGGERGAPIMWSAVGEHSIAVCSTEVDEGHFLSLQFVLPSIKIHPVGGFKDPHLEDEALSDAIHASISRTIESLTGGDGFKRGLMVRVVCGWGKGYAERQINIMHEKWQFESLSAADLVRLSWLSEMSPAYFWRVQDALEAAKNVGLEISNPNGPLNLIGWVRHNNGHLVPHEQLPAGRISPDRPINVVPPLNLIREVRADSDTRYDRHHLRDNVGRSHDVQRSSPASYFESKSSKRIYASMDDIKRGVLTSVYEGKHILWASVVGRSLERGVILQLWEMTGEWLHRVGHALDMRVGKNGPQHNLKLHIEFLDEGIPEAWECKPTAERLEALCVIANHEEIGACRVVFDKGFVHGFRIAENVAERVVVRTLARAYLSLMGDNSNEALLAIESQVVLNSEGRCFHLFHTQKFQDYVRDSLPKTVVGVDSLDDASARLGLGWRVLPIDSSGKIEGKKSCCEFLTKVVQSLLDEIVDGLGKYNKLSTLTRLVANNEKSGAENDHWVRTSAAVLGLHGHGPATVDRFVEESSKFAAAGIASRTLIELAVCVCPFEGAGKLSDIELSKLIARAALVCRLGGISDAIYYNALSPIVRVSPLGDILFCDDFGRMVVEPMLARVIGERYATEAKTQACNYDEPAAYPEIKGAFGDEFWRIWVIEMGFSLDEAREIVGVLEDKGVRDGSALLHLRRSEYRALVARKVVTQAADRFLDRFVLQARERWDVPPAGFDKKDIYPWRFRRRLSYVSRSILMIDDGVDPLLIVAPTSLRKSLGYLASGAYTGRLPQSFFQSDEMRNAWWGVASEGHSFNAEVAAELTAAGWQVRENLGIPEIVGQKQDKDDGDVDVLAWKIDSNRVLVIECKDLSPARNYSEIAALLSDYQGEVRNGIPDSLRRHLNRVEILRRNLRQLGSLTGITDPFIEPWLVCSGVVPMQYAKYAALSRTAIGGVQDILNDRSGR